MYRNGVRPDRAVEQNCIFDLFIYDDRLLSKLSRCSVFLPFRFMFSLHFFLIGVNVKRQLEFYLTVKRI